MTNFEARKERETLEQLTEQNEKARKQLALIKREYLSQEGLDALEAHEAIDNCLTFATTKEEAKENIENCIKTSGYGYIALNAETVKLVERYKRYHF